MKTALILGAAAVGVYLLLKHIEGAATPIGSAAPSPPPVAPGISPGRTAASTPAGAQMRSYAAPNAKIGGSVALGGLIAVQLGRTALPTVSFTPSSPGVSINQVTPPQAPKVDAITQPGPPMTMNQSNGLSRNLVPTGARRLV